MVKKEKVDMQILQILNDNCKAIERLGWKHLDSEQFSSFFLKMLKSLAQLTPRVTKGILKKNLSAAKLNISEAEAAHLADKVKNAYTYVREKIRNSGSGRYLPMPCRALLNIWCKQGHGKRAAKKKEKLEAMGAGKADDDEMPTQKKAQNIRETLGLGPKKKAPLVHIHSSDEESDEGGADATACGAPASATLASGSRSSTSALPSAGSGDCQQKPPCAHTLKNLSCLSS